MYNLSNGMKRFFKHFTYGIFYLALFAGLGYLVYLGAIKPPPSCFDNIQNQKEEGVDCGGPCAKICLPPTIRPITTEGQAQVFIAPGGLVGAIFPMQNPNPDYAINDFAYDINIYAADGALLKTVSGHSFIYAGEIKYIVATALDIGSGTPDHASFDIKDPVWIRAENFPEPRLEIQAANATISGNNVQATGRVLNLDTVTLPNVKVVAIFSNNLGEQIGVSETELDGLGAGELRNFVILHPALPDLNLSSTRIFVYALHP